MADLAGRLNTLANYAWGVSPGSRSPLSNRKVRLVAHRGAHETCIAIENTLPAFKWCLDHGVWGIELDIRLTRDGEPVIHHDAHCGRLFGRYDIQIAQFDFQQLREAIPQIPHLSEVVAQFGGKLHLMLEIKESATERADLPEKVSQYLAPLKPGKDFHLLSLQPEFLEHFADFVPRSAYIDVAWFNTREIIKRNLALGHGAISGSFALLGTRTLKQLQQRGCGVGTGFVETAGALRREVYREVDWIFTDCIMELQSVLQKSDGKTGKQ